MRQRGGLSSYDPDEYCSPDSSCRPGCYSGCGWRSWPRRGSFAWCLRLQQRTCLSKREDTSEWRRARTGCGRRRVDGRGLTRLPQRVADSGPSVRPLTPCLGELYGLTPATPPRGLSSSGAENRHKARGAGSLVATNPGLMGCRRLVLIAPALGPSFRIKPSRNL
jgi:hypothetical protein